MFHTIASIHRNVRKAPTGAAEGAFQVAKSVKKPEITGLENYKSSSGDPALGEGWSTALAARYFDSDARRLRTIDPTTMATRTTTTMTTSVT